jgi:CO/xanthine dehydrogenase FAD-binding subunit
VSYLRPKTLSEARAAHPSWAVIAGGTDLMVGANERPAPEGLLDLWGLRELTGAAVVDGVIRIGAATPYAELIASPLVRRELPSLWNAVREIGAVQIQSRGTIGGNVVTSSPVGDTLPVLLAFYARIEVASTRGTRHIPYQEFITGYRKTALAPDELVTAIELAQPPPGTHQFWRKVGTRRAQAISKVMCSAFARLAGGWIEFAAMAFGAVADRPIRIPDAEKLLIGQQPTPELAERIALAVRDSITPIDDVRSSADYRREVAGKIAARFVLELCP